MESLGIGFSNLVNSNRIIAIVSPETNPIKRIVQKLRKTTISSMLLLVEKLEV